MQQSNNNRRKHNAPTLIDIPLFKYIFKDPRENSQRSWVLQLNQHSSKCSGQTVHLCSTDKLYGTGTSPSQQMITEMATAH